MRGADADRATGAGVGPLGALAHDDEVDVGSPASGLLTPGYSCDGRRLTWWSSSKRIRSSSPRSSTPLGTDGSPMAPSRIASCVAQFVDEAVGQHLTGRVVAPGTQVVLGLLDAGQHDVEHLERLVDDLGSDAVAGDDGQLHDRSTSSSVVGADVACRCAVEHVGGHLAVEPQHDRRAVAVGVLAELRGQDVDPGAAEQRADLAQRAGLVAVVDDQVDALGAQVEVAAVDLDDLLHLLRTRQRARDVDHRAVGGHRAHVDDAAVVGALRCGGRWSASTPRSAASAGALTNVTWSSMTAENRPRSAESRSTSTSSEASSPRTCTDSDRRQLGRTARRPADPACGPGPATARPPRRRRRRRR